MMTDARVIKATFTEWRMVKTRKVLQLVLEIPLEQQGEVLTRLGPPMPDQERWVAVALLDELVASETEQQHKAKDLSRSLAGKKRYADSSAMEKARIRAATLPKDPEFQVWVGCRSEDAAAAFVRRACHVESRREIATDSDAFEAFLQLDRQFANRVTGTSVPGTPRLHPYPVRMTENRG